MDYERPFEVVDEEQTTSKSDKDLLDSFAQKALNDGYPSNLVQAAVRLSDDSIVSYNDFETIAIERALSEVDAKKKAAIARESRLVKSAQIALESVEAISNPNSHLESLLYKVYNTTAITAMDMLQRSEGSPELRLNLYKKPIFSLIIQIETDWVKGLVKKCLEFWKTDKYTKNYISRYMKDAKIDSPDKLMSLLPDVIKQENSPKEYKLFRAVQLARKQGILEEVLDMDFVPDDAFLCFNDTVDSTFKNNTPFLVAETVATEEAIREMSPAERKSLFQNAGTLYGKAINFKYQTAESFDAAMRESLGDYYEPWKQSRDTRIAERKERRKQKQAQRLAKAQAAANQTAANRNNVQQQRPKSGADRYAQAKQDMYRKSYQDDRYRSTREPVNIGPNYRDIPLPFIVLGVHLLLALILWLVLGGVKALFIVICFTVVTVGFFMFKRDKLKSVLAIALGYVVTFIVIII